MSPGMDKEKDKDRAELYVEYIEDHVRELIVNHSESESDRSRHLAEEGKLTKTLFDQSDHLILYFFTLQVLLC